EISVRKDDHELEKDGLIKKESVKQEIGRPYHVYELTGEGHTLFPNQYKQLPLDLLKDLEVLQGREAVSDLLHQRMKREKSDIENEIKKKDFTEKITRIAEIQERKESMVEVKQTINVRSS